MGKPKFNPIITRIKLNPEQAVLACTCWSNRLQNLATGRNVAAGYCVTNANPRATACSRSARASVTIS
jgi:hypothetical protein